MVQTNNLFLVVAPREARGLFQYYLRYNRAMKIEWNKVTKLSQIVSIVLFVAVFALGFYLGTLY